MQQITLQVHKTNIYIILEMSIPSVIGDCLLYRSCDYPKLGKIIHFLKLTESQLFLFLVDHNVLYNSQQSTCLNIQVLINIE